MRKLRAVWMMVLGLAGTATALELRGVNFYMLDAACEKGTRIGADDMALPRSENGQFVMDTDGKNDQVLFVGFEVSRETSQTSVTVEWIAPGGWCHDSEVELSVEQQITEMPDLGWHTRACRTMRSSPNGKTDCRGDWTVKIKNAVGDVLGEYKILVK